MVGKPARWRAMRLAFKTPKPKNGEIRKTMIPHPSANLYQGELKTSLHPASVLSGRRELDGEQLRRLLCRWLRLRLFGSLHWTTLLCPRCRLRLRLGRHLEIGRIRRLHLGLLLHLRLLLNHPLLWLWHIGHLRRSGLVLLRHSPCFRRSSFQLEICLRQSTRRAEEYGLRWHGQYKSPAQSCRRVPRIEHTKQSRQALPLMLKNLLTALRFMYAGTQPM